MPWLSSFILQSFEIFWLHTVHVVALLPGPSGRQARITYYTMYYTLKRLTCQPLSYILFRLTNNVKYVIIVAAINERQTPG
jgi:hypothetical protein